MFILVLGREKSGKSRYAESLALSLSAGAPVYAATLVPVGEGEAGRARIERHRAQRKGMGFETVERPMNLSGIMGKPGRTALLEDVSNLLANHIFSGGGPKTPSGGVEAALDDVTALLNECEHLIAVTLTGLSQSREYDGDTNGYIEALERLNRELLEISGAAVTVENGLARVIKGSI